MVTKVKISHDTVLGAMITSILKSDMTYGRILTTLHSVLIGAVVNNQTMPSQTNDAVRHRNALQSLQSLGRALHSWNDMYDGEVNGIDLIRSTQFARKVTEHTTALLQSLDDTYHFHVEDKIYHMFGWAVRNLATMGLTITSYNEEQDDQQ